MSDRRKSIKRQTPDQGSKVLRRSKRRHLMESQEGPSEAEGEAAAPDPSTSGPDNREKAVRPDDKDQSEPSSELPDGGADPSSNAVAERSYKAQRADELSFEKSDVITLLESENGDRLKGRCNGKEGYFPKEMLSTAKATRKFPESLASHASSVPAPKKSKVDILSDDAMGSLKDIPSSKPGIPSDKVFHWLNDIKLAEHHSTFIQNGFDTLELVSDLDKEDLDAMKIKRGHQKKIMQKLGKKLASQSGPPTLKALPAAVDYHGKTPEELSFVKGDLVIILEERPGGMWMGSSKGTKGLFPHEALFGGEKDEKSAIEEEKENGSCRPEIAQGQAETRVAATFQDSSPVANDSKKDPSSLPVSDPLSTASQPETSQLAKKNDLTKRKSAHEKGDKALPCETAAASAEPTKLIDLAGEFSEQDLLSASAVLSQEVPAFQESEARLSRLEAKPDNADKGGLNGSSTAAPETNSKSDAACNEAEMSEMTTGRQTHNPSVTAGGGNLPVPPTGSEGRDLKEGRNDVQATLPKPVPLSDSQGGGGGAQKTGPLLLSKAGDKSDSEGSRTEKSHVTAERQASSASSTGVTPGTVKSIKCPPSDNGRELSGTVESPFARVQTPSSTSNVGTAALLMEDGAPEGGVEKGTAGSRQPTGEGDDDGDDHFYDCQENLENKSESDGGARKKQKSSLDADQIQNAQKDKNSELEVQRSLQASGGMKVNFHALLHSEWGLDLLNKGHIVGIRFGGKQLGNWKKTVVVMKIEEMLDTKDGKMLKLLGSLIVPQSLKTKRIPYKYVFCTTDKAVTEWEFLYDGERSGHVNRVLVLPNDLNWAPEGVVEKFDDVIRKRSKSAWWPFGSSGGNVRSSSLEIAIHTMVPKWKGFFPQSFGSVIDLPGQEAVNHFVTVVQSLSFISIMEDGSNRGVINAVPDGFDIKKVVSGLLKPKLAELGKLESLVDDRREERLLSAVAISLIVKHFQLEKRFGQLDYTEYNDLLMNFSLTPDNEKRQCAAYDCLLINFEDKKTVLAAVMDILRVVCVKVHPSVGSWIYAMPLIHFLSDTTLPFEFKALNAQKSDWWALCGLERELKQWRHEAKPRTLLDAKFEIAALFAFDPLLARVVLFSVKFSELNEWVDKVDPTEFTLAAVKRMQDVTGIKPSTVLNFVGPLVGKVAESSVDHDKENAHIISGVTGSSQLLSLVCSQFRQRSDRNLVRRTVDLVFAFLAALKRTVKSGLVIERKQNEKNLEIEVVEKAGKDIVKWLQYSAAYTHNRTADSARKDAETWNAMFEADPVEEELRVVWFRPLENGLIEQLKKDNEERILKAISLMGDAKFHPAVDKCLMNMAELALDKLIAKNGNPESAFDSLSVAAKSQTRQAAHSRRLLVILLERSTPREDASRLNWLNNLFSWPLWLQFLRFSGELSAGREVVQILCHAENVLVEFVERLSSGEISVKEYRLVEQHRAKLLDLCSVVDDRKTGISLRVRANSSLALRSRELRAFEAEQVHVVDFVGVCRLLGSVAINELKNLAQLDVSDMPVRKLAVTVNDVVKVVFFSLPDDIRECIGRLNRVKQSQIFRKYWERRGEEVKEERSRDDGRSAHPLTLDELVEAVIQPVWGRWSGTCKVVREGTIALQDVRNLFKSMLGKEDQLREELGYMRQPGDASDSWVKERVKQILQYTKLDKSSNAARAVIRVCQVLGIRCFFSVTKILEQNSQEFGKQPLSVMTSEVVKASRFLTEMKENEVFCLNKFADCHLLVAWVRTELTEWKELETFVELAGTRSSAEGDFEAIKVAHLRAACAGFSSLLFDVKEDVTFRQFRDSCRNVFSKLSRDKLITQKWSDTEKYLADFKVMKDCLGSVEVSSFSEVELINSRGQYSLGCRSKEAPQDVSDCIRLEIRALDTGGDAASRKKYSLSDLQDLQSKLILISGYKDERRDEVNVFVDSLECATRLAANSVALCRAGHVKYLNWTKSFDCVSPLKQLDDPEGEENVQVLRVEGLLHKMRKTATEMEKDLSEWKQKMSDDRARCYYLNYFTTAQLLILGGELGRLALDRAYSLPNYVYGILECVKSNINANDVSSSMGKACARRQPSPRRQPLSSMFGQSTFAGGGFSLGGGQSSYFGGSFTGEDFSIGVESSLEVPTFDSSLLSFQTPMDVDLSGSRSHQILTDPEPEPVPEVGPFNLDNPEYLSLETLGSFLETLAQSAPRPPSRSFRTDHLTLGKPNLIVVPEAELIQTVLSLYMEDPDRSLPSSQEVLLCSMATTAEDVTLFWRRAIKDPSHGRLFCLAGADRLTYEVSRDAVDELYRLGQGLSGRRGENYRLVVVCCSENEDRSYIVSALDQHRRQALPCRTPRQVQDYLKRQFQRGPASQRLRTVMGTTWAPAAEELDHEQSCVRVVYSTRAGVGKSLFIEHMAGKLSDIPNNQQARSYVHGADDSPTRITVPLHELEVDTDVILETLEPAFPSPEIALSRLIHFDISPSVRKGLEELLFNLLVLGQVIDSKGRIWRRRLTDMYVLECTWPADQASLISTRVGGEANKRIHFAYFLPAICRGSPEAALQLLKIGRNPTIDDPSFDKREFGNSNFQRSFQYLDRFNGGQNLDPFKFIPGSAEGTPPICLQILFENCGVANPSWSVLKHFVNFLSSQLRDCEQSDFCNPDAYGEDLPGFKNFVMKLMIRMSRDFSTPSLNIDLGRMEEAGNLAQYKLRRCWEQSPHPYLFFNEDRHAMTFVGLRMSREGQLVHMRTGEILEEEMMSRELSTALYTQGFRLQEDYETWTKQKKIETLCAVMGLPFSFDPDDSYELTVDNVIKISAIHMRFRCGIPVVVMGETGCGKTRLIRYMCSLQSRDTGARNMLLMKVHGGVTRRDIILKVHEAQLRAELNRELRVKTVLFFDEANTTDAVGLIKEIMCDKRVNGQRIRGLGSDLHVIAACNPYRKHTDVMIEKLESAGLGYHVRTDDTEDRLGHIPLRQLVYRVHPLPDSMKSLVWDFGQLKPEAEKLYIRQIVSRRVVSLGAVDNLIDVVTEVLAVSQKFMRQRNDECSFVSLRDVERAMMVMVWFHQLDDALLPYIIAQYDEAQENVAVAQRLQPLDRLTRSLVLALGVSYHARLQDRQPFRQEVSRYFTAPCLLSGGQAQMLREIEYCQSAFLDELELPPKIGKNHALKENVFMMVVCTDLRIPLFLVGKPGSSKSLAKDVVKNAMRGDLSSSQLFKRLKQVHMVSYQCSPLSTAEGIISTFSQCQRVQKENDLEKFVACVVLDEVGLAEDSPRLPLKALHPLLDDGSAGADDGEDEKESNHVAFIGISNWALDPAKMNRGILVQREVPSDEELVVSARGICSTDDYTLRLMEPIVAGMASAYLEIYKELKRKNEKEFFGLRDFYSLVKMMFSFCKKTAHAPTWGQLLHAIRRNFGGLEAIDPLRIFHKHVKLAEGDGKEFAPDCSSAGLIKANLAKDAQSEDTEESRYLLLLTENYAALNIVRQRFLVGEDPVIIFGSSFSKDQEYTQICRNINRVKVCMATGRTVVLLNLEKLYESLYDALNQYYVYHGGQRFVDLGLGSHRVKCQVHKDFRLILIADREVVYSDYPIPLINRMEKHFLAMSSILTRQQTRIVDDVDCWAKAFGEVNLHGFVESRGKTRFTAGDAFVGFHEDAVATVVLRVCQRIAEEEGRDELNSGEGDDEWETKVRDEACFSLLRCATPDAIARLPASSLRERARGLWDMYFQKQSNSNLVEYVGAQLLESKESRLIQITTHARLLSPENILEVERRVRLQTESISLQQFDTEQQFCERVGEFYSRENNDDSILLVLCETGDVNGDLVACARYLVQEERDKAYRKRKDGNLFLVNRHIIFVIHLSRVAGGCFVGFQGGAWTEVHIDDLRPANQANHPSITSLVGRKISSLFGPIENKETAMDEDIQQLRMESMEVDEGEDEVGAPVVEDAVLSAAALFRSCVHGATSRLDDPDEMTSESANWRLSLLLGLIPEDETSITGVRPFYDELKRRIVALLIEREERAGDESAREWVKNEALSHNSIQAGGTFRHSLWLKIVDVITPILAELISFMDANSNLGLLQDAIAGASYWVTDLWIDLFSTPQLTTLHFKDFLSPGENPEPRQRVLVKGYGYQNHPFTARFPFSGVIKEELDVLIEEAKNLSDPDKLHLSDTLQRLFDDSRLGGLVRKHKASVPKGGDEFVEAYLHDFVHMVYSPCEKGHFGLVSSAIISGFNELSTAAFHGEDTLTHELMPARVLTIPAIHAAYEYLRSRLACFSELVCLSPDLVASLHQQLGTDPKEEMTLDAVSFTMFLEELQPTAKDLQFNVSRQKWLRRVQEAKPCIEAWLALSFRDDLSLRPALNTAVRVIWTKICAVRLYFEHTKELAKSDFVITAGGNLWKCFEDKNPDFGAVETVDLILNFLDRTSRDCSERLFGPNDGECSVCSEVWKDPVQLPCKHIFCFHCITNWMENQRSCPMCKHLLQGDYQPQTSTDLKKRMTSFCAFKSNCTAFFMELVATYTFNEHARTPPHPELVERLMSFVTRRRPGEGAEKVVTRAFSPFTSDAIDNTPVVRSFLLQLLLRYSGQNAMNYVQEYFVKTRQAVEHHSHGAVSQQDEEELGVIFVQCMEDSVTRSASQGYRMQVGFALRDLRLAVTDLQAERHSLAYLKAVAGVRFGLCVAAEWIFQLLDDQGRTAIPQERAEVFSLAEQLCTGQYDQQIVVFLLKQFVRRRGTDVLDQLQKIYELRWLEDAVSRLKQDDEEAVPDYFVVLGATYKPIRDAVARAIHTSSVRPIADAVKAFPANTSKSVKAVSVLLAFYREVTQRKALLDEARQISGEMQNKLEELCRSAAFLPDWAKAVGRRLLDNTLGGVRAPPAVAAIPGQNLQTRAAAGVALHVLLAIESSAENNLMRPLLYMLKQPARLTESYFPTMPDDNFMAVRGAAAGDAGTAWHECPNGHPYFIDNCGKPTTMGTCFCGAQIGGKNYHLAAQNVAGARQHDATEKGHVLGRPAGRSNLAAAERDLSSQSCAFMRVLMHAALMWASCSDDRQLVVAVAQIVKPGVHEAQLSEFFWEHFEKDLKAFSKAIGQTPNDASVVIHQILNGLIIQHQDAFGGDGTLKSKEERRTWERQFSQRFIVPVLQKLGQKMRPWMDAVMHDERVGTNPLTRMLYELEAPPGACSPAVFWRYRAMVSVEHLSVTLEQQSAGNSEQHKILKEFLKEERNLRMLQFLPRILRLQRMLLEKFHRRIASHEAKAVSIGDFLQTLSEREKKEYTALIQVFSFVWVNLGPEIFTHGRLKPKKEEDKLLEVNLATPIAFLLPTTTGQGTCAMSLVEYLINCVQNEFVARFRNLSDFEGRPPTISMNEVTNAQLISYDYEKDFLPLLLAHCNYSLEVGRGSDITYDFAALERQLVDRFLTGKPKIKFQVHQFAFSRDAYTSDLFVRIAQKIPQEKISVPVARQIVEELHDLTEVYGVLSVLDVLIGFVGSTGGEPEKSVHDYLHNTLKMPLDRGLVSTKAQQYCQLQHVLSLWRILTVEKGRRLVLTNRDPFEDLPARFKKDIDEDVKATLVEALRKINLDSLMGETMKLTWLEVKNRSSMDGLEDYGLKDALEEFCHSNIDGLSDIPDEVQLRHLLDFWSSVVKLQASLER